MAFIDEAKTKVGTKCLLWTMWRNQYAFVCFVFFLYGLLAPRLVWPTLIVNSAATRGASLLHFTIVL